MKNNINVITSYYNDFYKLDWDNLVHQKNYNLVIYKKSDTLKIGESTIIDNQILIPNYGRCDYAFLYYIITNYDNLPDRTIFTKINWKEQSINFDILLNECLNYDYYEAGKGLKSYVWYDNNSLHLKQITSDFYQNIDNPSSTGNLFDLKNRLCEAETFEDWYNYIFPNRCSLPGKIYAFDHGPCFSVSRDLIKRHPIEIYRYLFEKFHEKSKSWNHSKINVENIGHHYHNHFLRFYKILFTHDVDNIKIGYCE